ncbi:hypothetical protein ABIE61_001788 [Marinobacterium sp. MBR-111]
MAHFDADQETVDRLKRLGWKKESPLDMDLTGADREFSPELLAEIERLSSSVKASRDSGARLRSLKPPAP